jgi:hypothetical protein
MQVENACFCKVDAVTGSLPTTLPSDYPSLVPSVTPSAAATALPDVAYSDLPSDAPSELPSQSPSVAPASAVHAASQFPVQPPAQAPPVAQSDECGPDKEFMSYVVARVSDVILLANQTQVDAFKKAFVDAYNQANKENSGLCDRKKQKQNKYSKIYRLCRQ